MPRPFHRARKHPLMFGAISGNALWKDFSFFRHEFQQLIGFLKIQPKIPLLAKLTNALAEKPSAAPAVGIPSAAHSASGASRPRGRAFGSAAKSAAARLAAASSAVRRTPGT